MNKPELIDKITLKMGKVQRRKIEASVNLILELIADKLASGGRAEFRGFGVFDVKWQKERMALNPKSGAPVLSRGKAVPKFKVGKELRERVNATHLFFP